MKKWLVGVYCDGCRNTCELTHPRCSHGGRQAGRWLNRRREELERRAQEAEAVDDAVERGSDSLSATQYADDSLDANVWGVDCGEATYEDELYEAEKRRREEYWDQFDL